MDIRVKETCIEDIDRRVNKAQHISESIVVKSELEVGEL